MLRWKSPLLVALVAASTAIAYWVGTTPPDPMAGREILAVAISGTGRYWAAGTASGWVFLRDREEPEALQQIRAGEGPIDSLAFSPDESTLIIANLNLASYPVGELASLRLLRDDRRGYRSVGFNAAGTSLLALTGESTIETFDPQTGEFQQGMCCVEAGGAAFVDGGRRIASGGDWPAVWDATTGQLLGRLAREREIDTLGPAAFDGEGSRILMGSRDGYVYTWDAASGDPGPRSPRLSGGVDDLAVLQDGWIAYGRRGAQLRLWNPANGAIEPLAGAVPTSDVRPGPATGTLLFGNDAGSVELWDTARGSFVDRFTVRQ